jgi:Rrf2 family iron-sulfur cluster assembly transcriptional regulator
MTHRTQPVIAARADYACRALLSLALHPEDRPVSARRIAERTGMPAAFLKQVLLDAKAAGLIRPTRGVQGGYELAHPPDQITLAHITSSASPSELPRQGKRRALRPHIEPPEGQVVEAVWQELGRHIDGYLSTVTLAELVAVVRGARPVVS